MRILDTTFLVDLTKGEESTLNITGSKEELLTTKINMFEFIRGLFLRGVSSRKYLEIMELFEDIRVLPLDDNSLIKAAEISAELIKGGKEISDSDCLIAGIALSKGINEIVTRNTKHFNKIKGIKVISY